jgi:hypothetical protein
MIHTLRNDKISLALLLGALVLAGIGAYRLAARADTSLAIRTGDGPLYETVESLLADADLVVLGTVGEVLDRYEDLAGNPQFDERGDPIPPLKKVIVELRVDRLIYGATDRAILPVVLTDSQGVVDDWTPDLRVGQDVVVFLFEVPAEEGSAELRTKDAEHGGVFGVVGGKQGVFDVAGQKAVSRSDLASLQVDLTQPLGD